MSNKSLHDDRGRSAARPVSPSGKTACIDAGQVFDSCSDRDCVEGLKVWFTSRDQQTVDNAAVIRAKKAKVLTTCMDVDELPFKDGCYSCKLTFFIEIEFEVRDQCGECVALRGVTSYEKRVVLYGGEGSVNVFAGDLRADGCVRAEMASTNMPRCHVQVAEPVVLDALLAETVKCRCTVCCDCEAMPGSVCARYGGGFCEAGGKTVTVTLGLFTIVQMIRQTQLLVPAYEYCVPCKECSCDEETPCEVFRKMNFPIEEFFPTANCKGNK